MCYPNGVPDSDSSPAGQVWRGMTTGSVNPKPAAPAVARPAAPLGTTATPSASSPSPQAVPALNSTLNPSTGASNAGQAGDYDPETGLFRPSTARSTSNAAYTGDLGNPGSSFIVGGR